LKDLSLGGREGKGGGEWEAKREGEGRGREEGEEWYATILE
jgi:hypothetical protein